jgi:CheY-like chemotaxis protein/anti-sigma regulatory factor (Ser/Thr protein kinase)
MSHKVLLVDDSATDLRLVCAVLRKRTALTLTLARSGEEALAAVERETPDILVTDLLMPGMTGMDLLAQVRERYPHLPVVMMTGHGSEDVTAEALRRGAASYVPKRLLLRDLAETIEKVLLAATPSRRKQDLLQSLTTTEFTFCLENDPRVIRPLILHVQEFLVPMGVCDDSERVRVGIALEEAILNAMYHGNLELSSQIKESGQDYHRAADERRGRSPYRDRRIHVHVRFAPSEAVFTVRDEGSGYDTSKLPDPTHPEQLENVSGRGLLLIRSFMDEVAFNESGNQITMVKRRPAPLAGRPDR